MFFIISRFLVMRDLPRYHNVCQLFYPIILIRDDKGPNVLKLQSNTLYIWKHKLSRIFSFKCPIYHFWKSLPKTFLYLDKVTLFRFEWNREQFSRRCNESLVDRIETMYIFFTAYTIFGLETCSIKQEFLSHN